MVAEKEEADLQELRSLHKEGVVTLSSVPWGSTLSGGWGSLGGRQLV
jgi:hypothetical protein